MTDQQAPVQEQPVPVSGQPIGDAGRLTCATGVRRELTFCERVEAGLEQTRRQPWYEVPDNCPVTGCTPDELNFPRYAASFHKLLYHDADGLLTDDATANSGVANYRHMLQGLMIQAPSSFFNTPALDGLKLPNRTPTVGGKPARPRVLINPRSGKALSIKGPDIAGLGVGKIVYGPGYAGSILDEISLSSGPSAAEMVEVYAMALLRGIRFDQYATAGGADGALLDLVVGALNEFGADFIWGYPNHVRETAATVPVTRANLFRGARAGARAGDYLSVFLTFKRPPLFPSGCAPHVADLIGAAQFAPVLSQDLLVPDGQDSDFGLTLATYAAIQNAYVPDPYPAGHFTGLVPLKDYPTGRHLGDYVHVDNAYEEYIRAADILTAHQYPRTPLSPYSDPRTGALPQDKHYPNEGDGPTLGPGDAWALVGAVRGVAERAAWTRKYLVARRGRPEVMAALIHLAHPQGGNRADLRSLLDPRLFVPTSKVYQLLEQVKAWNLSRGGEANYLLSQMFPEGSPAHPSWPSGHATVAGACVTVLKAIFDDCHFVIDPNSPPADPQPYVSNGQPLNMGDELDKLASNIAFGRDFAGVHYRSDGEHGILLGEEVAIRYLQDHLREYREEIRQDCRAPNFTLTRRNGTRICITPDDVQAGAACPVQATARIHPKAQL